MLLHYLPIFLQRPCSISYTKSIWKASENFLCK